MPCARTSSLQRFRWLVPLIAAVLWPAAGVPAAVAQPGDDAGGTPPLGITGMTFVSSTADAAEVVVHAETAEYRPEADVADLQGVRATVATGSAGRTLEIACDEGTLNLKSNSFWARGNVHGTTDDGREFRAPWVRYDHTDGLLFTDAPVLLTEAGTTLQGGGFRYYVREERFRLLGGAQVVQDP